MRSNSLIESFEKARIQSIESVMKASDWKLQIHDRNAMVPSSIFLYVYDTQSKWLWLCTIAKTDFYFASAKLHTISVEQSASAVAAFIGLHNGEPSGTWEAQLALALTAYITKTATYQQGKGVAAPHFVVINYGATNNVRPFAIPGSDRFALPVDQIHKMVAQVIDRDKLLHPHWVS